MRPDCVSACFDFGAQQVCGGTDGLTDRMRDKVSKVAIKTSLSIYSFIRTWHCRGLKMPKKSFLRRRNGHTNQWMDGWKDQQMGRPYYRAARTQLKNLSSDLWHLPGWEVPRNAIFKTGLTTNAMDWPIDRQMDTPCYRDARTYLKDCHYLLSFVEYWEATI